MQLGRRGHVLVLVVANAFISFLLHTFPSATNHVTCRSPPSVVVHGCQHSKNWRCHDPPPVSPSTPPPQSKHPQWRLHAAAAALATRSPRQRHASTASFPAGQPLWSRDDCMCRDTSSPRPRASTWPSTRRYFSLAVPWRPRPDQRSVLLLFSEPRFSVAVLKAHWSNVYCYQDLFFIATDAVTLWISKYTIALIVQESPLQDKNHAYSPTTASYECPYDLFLII